MMAVSHQWRPQMADAQKYMLRLPDGLRDRIKVSAAEARRSMNAEIVYHLERALEPASDQKSQAA